MSFVNGRLNLNVEKDSFVTVDFGEPIFEPEKIPFKAKQSEKTYIIRAADFNILCGVVSVSGPFCVVEEKDFSSERVNVIGKALSTHERFYDQAGVVFFPFSRLGVSASTTSTILIDEASTERPTATKTLKRPRQTTI